VNISEATPVKLSLEKPWKANVPPFGQVWLLRKWTVAVADALAVDEVELVGADEVGNGTVEELVQLHISMAVVKPRHVFRFALGISLTCC
jgi:hypothetical protein